LLDDAGSFDGFAARRIDRGDCGRRPAGIQRRSFRQIYPRKKVFREITCVLAGGNGHLFIGTKERGVLIFDGKKITVLRATLGKMYVTALAGTEADLWLGTIDRGVLHWHAGETETFGEQQGMPDPQVLSIALEGDKAFVGTPMGVGMFEGGNIHG
jgi:ligand-binding sensor domain-containing protein